MPVQLRDPTCLFAASFGSAAAIGSTMRPMTVDAALVFLESIVAGIGGAVAGKKVRGHGGFAALGALAKSAH